mmetsp:Transcript_20713/g.25500  ORF Transcript_20713/g.25500 Transcript_20713/m.25500 type:complete len:182 (+) Transcript_20713:290-835(+)
MEHRVCRISQTIEILQNYIDEITQSSFWERSKPEFDLAVIGMMILFFVGSTYTYRSHRRLREYNIIVVHSELSKLDRDRALAHMHGQISFQIVHSEEERSTSVDAGASSTIYYSCILVNRWIHDNNSSGNQYNPLAQDFHDEYFGSDDPSKFFFIKSKVQVGNTTLKSGFPLFFCQRKNER